MKTARSASASAVLLLSLLTLVPTPFLQAQANPGQSGAAAQPVVDPSLYAGMEYRMVGPFRGGRVTAVTGIAEEPHTYFHGGTGGGVWKTTDAGHHWTPIADEYLTSGNVGAIDVADSDPNVIYVGTGSACIRGNISVGRGVWKTTNGGGTWAFIGLPESGAIGSLVVHPRDPDRVYVAALGHPFGKNPERGIYRSSDGGDTWEHVLSLNDSTGAVSLAMDPTNPRIIYAGMWRAERKPWKLISGGPEGGLYKTTDGGDTWTKLGGGLPEGIVGKVTVSVSRTRPDRVWAMVEAEPGNGLWRSDDAGKSWRFMNGESRLTGRPFYYHHVVADPGDENTVWVLNTRMYRSVDGGESFELVPVHHGDVHDLWINPSNSDYFVVGDDGGAEVSLNGGETLSGVYNQPTAEFYDVMVDNGRPYRLYGSQQDNTTVSVPVHRSNNNLRPQEAWEYAGGCEVGPIAFDPDDTSVIWSGCYGGIINIWDRTTDVRRNVNLYPSNQNLAPKELRYRFQWIAPIVMDPLDSNTIYHASQYVHRTTDGGMTWETISPDLTTDTPEHQEFPGGPIHSDHTGVEVFNTVFSVEPSPHEAGTIWVGTDDGRVHITRDDGESWTEITPPHMPRYGTVNRIEISPHRPGRAFLAVNRYRMDDWHPYVFRTDDYGESWELLTDGTNGIPADHWVRVVREDDVRPGLLYAGTEFGIFVSFDDGAHWQPLQMNLPASPVTDLKVHRGDLAVATQGRSFWVLDDLTPLRELAAGVMDAPVLLYTPRDVARGRAYPPMSEMDLNLPDPLPHGALLSYTVTGELDGLTMEVLDDEDRVAGRWEAAEGGAGEAGGAGGGPGDGASGGNFSSGPGFHRIAWPVRYMEDGGVKAPPGEYRVRMTWEGRSTERSFRVLPNPLDPSITQADYEEQFRVTMEVQEMNQEVREAIRRIRSVKEQAREVIAKAREAEADPGDLPAMADSLDARLRVFEAELTSVDDPTVPTGEKRPEGGGLDRELSALLYHLNSGGGYGAGGAEGRPTAGAMEKKRDLERSWSDLRSRMERALEAEVQAFNEEVTRLGLVGIVVR